MIKEAIITDRLRLRDLLIDDASDVYAIWSREENARYMSDPVTSVEEVRSILDKPEMRVGHLLGVVEKSSAQLVGTICCGPTDQAGEWGFGYSFAHSVWGKGYATETVMAVIEQGKREGITTFVSDCAKENIASSKVLIKCGMTLHGKGRFTQPLLNVEYESLIYKLTLQF